MLHELHFLHENRMKCMKSTKHTSTKYNQQEASIKRNGIEKCTYGSSSCMGSHARLSHHHHHGGDHDESTNSNNFDFD